MKVIEIIGRVENILKDTGVRWPRIELQQWLNDSYAEITSIRPDANSKTGEFTCVAGSRQDLTVIFANALRLIDVVRNTATTSNKRAVKLIDRSILDDMRPNWHTVTQSVDVQNYMYDEMIPRKFLVYPPATVLAKLEVAYSEVPAAHAITEGNLDPAGADTTLINLHPVYAPAIVDYIVYRAFSKDAGEQQNLARANMHRGAFERSLGVKTQVDVATSPNSRKE